MMPAACGSEFKITEVSGNYPHIAIVMILREHESNTKP